MKLFNFLLFTFSFVFAQEGSGSGDGGSGDGGSGDGGSGDIDQVKAQIETTVEMDLQTEIEYDAKLEDKSSTEYAAKKTALYTELKSALDNAAQATDSEVVEDGFDVTFSEVETSRKRRDVVKKMKAKVTQKFLSKSTEEFSDELQNTINEKVRKTVEGEVKNVTNEPGANSLLTAGQEVEATATSQMITWNSGKELKVCSTVFFAVVALGLLN